MSTTTIRLPDDLKARIAVAADRADISPHNFILQAIAEKTVLEQRRATFREEADRRYDGIVATGRTPPWETMRTYLEARAGGKYAAPPRARKLAR